MPEQFTVAELQVIRRFLQDRIAFWDHEVAWAEGHNHQAEADSFADRRTALLAELEYYLPRRK